MPLQNTTNPKKSDTEDKYNKDTIRNCISNEEDLYTTIISKHEIPDTSTSANELIPHDIFTKISKDKIFLEEIQKSSEEIKTKGDWLVKTVCEIKKERNRVPNGWWRKINNAYNEKFGCKTTLNSMKMLHSIKNRKDKLESNGCKRIKMVEEMVNVNNTHLYKNVKEEMYKNMKLESKDRKRTKKISSFTYNQEIIQYINTFIINENINSKNLDLKEIHTNNIRMPTHI